MSHLSWLPVPAATICPVRSSLCQSRPATPSEPRRTEESWNAGASKWRSSVDQVQNVLLRERETHKRLITHQLRLKTHITIVTFSQIMEGCFFFSSITTVYNSLPCYYFVSSRQLTEPGCSSAAGSHSKSFDHSHYRPYQGGGGGDSGDALSVTSVSSSGSDLEDVNPSFLSDSPEGHERKVRKTDGTETAKPYQYSWCFD